MTKITTLTLVFALVVVVALHSVVCEDNRWQSVIEEAEKEARKAGISEETINEAEKAINDGSAGKFVEGEGSLDDWVQQAENIAKSSGILENLLDDEEEDNLSGAPELSPKNAPSEAPVGTPINTPSETPSEAPQAQRHLGSTS